MNDVGTSSKDQLSTKRILEDYREKCRAKLSDKVTKVFGELAKRTPENSGTLDEKISSDLNACFREVLIEMARGLFCLGNAFKVPGDQMFDLYFWPGFESWQGTRLALECDHNGKQCGVGFTNQMESREALGYRVTDASTSFNLILDPLLTENFSDGARFSPAGTHSWAVAEKDRAKNEVKPPTLKDHGLLVALAVGLGHNPRKNAYVGPDGGSLTIELKHGDGEDIGPRVSGLLNGCDELDYPLRWPCPSPNTNVRPLERRGKDLSQSDKRIAGIWEDLYSTWLSTCFIEDWRSVCGQWMVRLSARVKKQGLEELASRIEQMIGDKPEEPSLCKGCSDCASNPDAPDYSHTYQWWYTLLLDKAVKVEDRSAELGSAMILCSHGLGSEFFSHAKPWIEEIYTLMRQVENAVWGKTADQDRAEGQKQALLASYAKGASHGLKNALALAQLTTGKQNPGQLMCGKLDLGVNPDADELYKLADSAGFMFNELAHLKEQAELFFWVMDPDRAKRELAKGVDRSVVEIVCGAIIRGLNLSTNGHKLQTSELKPIITAQSLSPQDFSNELSAVLRDAVGQIHKETESGPEWWYDQLILVYDKLANNTDLLVTAPSELSLAGICSGEAAYVLDAVMVELCQNAFKAAILSAGHVQQPSVSITAEREDDLLILQVTNTAIKDCRKSIEAFESLVLNDRLGPGEGGSGGIQGLWQIFMLCSKLGGSSVKMLDPLSGRSLLADKDGTPVVSFRVAVRVMGG